MAPKKHLFRLPVNNRAAVKAPRNASAMLPSIKPPTTAPTTTPSKEASASKPHTTAPTTTPSKEASASKPHTTAPAATPSKKNIPYSDNDVDSTASPGMAIYTSPRKYPIMANGRRAHPCCKLTRCEKGSFDVSRIGNGKDKPGWENYPRLCTGCTKDIKEGRQQETDEEMNITRVNAKRHAWMCQNAYNHRDHPCVTCFCFDCGDLAEKVMEQNATPTKPADPSNGNRRCSTRKRTSTRQCMVGEKKLKTGEIVPAEHGRRN